MKHRGFKFKLCMMLILLQAQAFGQFKKFKSSPRFDKKAPSAAVASDFVDNKNDSNSDQAPSAPSASRRSSNNNQANPFGNRKTSFGSGDKDPKYVNLNPETAFGPEIITSFDFPDTDILELTKHMQKLTGINLIVGKDVKGKVSISAPTAITVGDAWRAYLAALNMEGFTLVKAGAFWKVISAREVRYVPTKIYTGSYTPDTEAHMMKVIALKNVDASEISRNFRPFMSRYGRIVEIKQTNTIIISDTGSNIARLEKLIKFLDVPGYDQSLQIISVKNSSAQEIAKLLDEILKTKGGSSGSSRIRKTSAPRFAGGGDSGSISKIIAEPRTNSIIAMANAQGAKELKELINKLDVKLVSASSGSIHVHYLNFGNAEEIAKTLTNLISGAVANNNSGGAANRFAGNQQQQSHAIFNAEVKVTADKQNNALVVTASPTDWLTLKNVIAKLDIPRDQVYVEGLIMETTLNKVRAFGVNFVGAYGSGNIQRAGFGTDSADLTNVLSGNPVGINGFFAGIGGPERTARTFQIGENQVKINSVNGLIKAVASNEQTNVLATPQILAMDNTEAEFEVGQTVPVQNAIQGNNGIVQPNFQNQEAKLSLKITPQINKVTRFVNLKISQTIDDFIGTPSEAGNGGLPTTTRSAVTEVMIKDKDTVAMGGLLRDKESVEFSKVPLLGDIPVLGWLFKSKTKSLEKVNLLFFLTPKIISPYQKLAAENSLEVLENRTNNLKDGLFEDQEDSFKAKSQELAKKIQMQKEAGLIDNAPNPYLENNKATSDVEEEIETPDYQGIIQDLNEGK